MDKQLFNEIWLFAKTHAKAALEDGSIQNAAGIIVKTKSGSKYLVGKIEKTGKGISKRFECWSEVLFIVASKFTVAIPYNEIAEIFSEELKNNY